MEGFGISAFAELKKRVHRSLQQREALQLVLQLIIYFACFSYMYFHLPSGLHRVFYSLFGFLSSSVSAEIFAVFLSLLQVFWYMLCFWNGSACLCLHSCMCFALWPHYTDVHMLYIHDCWYNITVMMTRGVGLYTVFHITALQSCFCCTLCVTVILHLTFTFLIIHEGKHATKWELMHNTGLFREAACMPSGFKKKPVMIDARLAVETAIVY